MTEIALLANPQSGSGAAGEVEALLRERGARVSRFALDQIDDAVASRPRRIVVAGGDGSVACAAQAAGRASVPLAVVAVGTANDFARAIGLPLDPAEAAALAVAGTETRRLELGHMAARLDRGGIDERPFVNAASAGLSPVAARRAHGLKTTLGPLAYAVGALRAGLRAHPVRCRVTGDGAELFAGRAWQVTVACTGAFGGGAGLDADPGDGILHVVVIEAGSRARLVVHAYGMRAGRLEDQRGVRDRRACRVEVATDGATGFNVDGELIDARTVELTVEGSAFELVTG